ncbi:enoyl-CoA hydratase-related protein [Spongiibacter marinus]|uniref:enoyl-CoA hydratase-related protein n=1 Tax=Spongiibacter marinus TaxID=354246 RepID=UPI0035BE4F8B
MNASEHIEHQQLGHTLVITLNRPQKKNALTAAMYRTMTALLQQAEVDESIRAVLVTAKGDCFCAGNDIDGFALIAKMPYQQRPGFTFMNAICRFSKPLVAAVVGDAAGIGATLLLHCDLVYLSHKTVIRLPFIELGITPEFASTSILPARLGHCRAAELLWLKRSIAAADAVSAGLATQTAKAEEVMAIALDSCQQLGELPSQALLHSRRLMKQQHQPELLNKIEQETLAINELLATMRLPK